LFTKHIDKILLLTVRLLFVSLSNYMSISTKIKIKWKFRKLYRKLFSTEIFEGDIIIISELSRCLFCYKIVFWLHVHIVVSIPPSTRCARVVLFRQAFVCVLSYFSATDHLRRLPVGRPAKTAVVHACEPRGGNRFSGTVDFLLVR